MAKAAMRRKAAGIDRRQEGTIMKSLAIGTLAGILAWTSFGPVLAQEQPSGEGNASTARPNLLSNGDFERGMEGWNPFWSRQASTGSAVVKNAPVHTGKRALQIAHRGREDWSVAQAQSLPVRPGELYQFSGWVQLTGAGNCELSVILRDAAGEVIDWTYAGRSTHATEGWRKLNSRFLIPAGAATMLPRVIGYGPSTVIVDNLKLEREAQGD